MRNPMELLRESQLNAPVELKMTIRELAMIIGGLDLALRHPEMYKVPYFALSAKEILRKSFVAIRKVIPDYPKPEALKDGHNIRNNPRGIF